jgi:lysylphosphatidylglycerol synthetase-like protein (DUF2156 family)
MLQQDKAQTSHFINSDKLCILYLTLLALWLLLLLTFFLHSDIHLGSFVALGIGSVAAAMAAVIAQWPKSFLPTQDGLRQSIVFALAVIAVVLPASFTAVSIFWAHSTQHLPSASQSKQLQAWG